MNQPVLGIGIDCESVDRFRQFGYDEPAQFLTRLYTSEELRYCFAAANAAERLAGRYAAKEAVVKALTQATGKNDWDYRSIEIITPTSGAPLVRLPAAVAHLTVLVSISHTETMAVAMAYVYDK